MSRNLYEDVLMWEELIRRAKSDPALNSTINWDVVNSKLIELKRKARRANRVNDNYHFHPEESVVFSNDFESAYFKYPLPEYIKTLEDAEEYFEEYERIECRPSMYDCTGQRFTGFHHIFRKPDGRFWCYHRIDMDV